MGEAKKSFLRMAMWMAKAEDMPGIHAGAKIVRARDPLGEIKRYSMLLFGLSATQARPPIRPITSPAGI